MRGLRFRLAGYCIVAALRIMPGSRERDLLMDYLDEWYRERFVELTGETPPEDLSITRRYRKRQ